MLEVWVEGRVGVQRATGKKVPPGLETGAGCIGIHRSHFWELEPCAERAWWQRWEAEEIQATGTPTCPDLSHPEAPGRGKSMGSRSAGASGPGLEFDPCRVFTDLEADRCQWAHLYLERKLGRPDPDKATFYSMKTQRHLLLPPPPNNAHTVIVKHRPEWPSLGRSVLKDQQIGNYELTGNHISYSRISYIYPSCRFCMLFFFPPAVCKYWLSSRAVV